MPVVNEGEAGMLGAIFAQLWPQRRVAAGNALGEGYGEHNEEAIVKTEGPMPNFWVALLPIVLVISLFVVVSVPAGMTGSASGGLSLAPVPDDARRLATDPVWAH